MSGNDILDLQVFSGFPLVIQLYLLVSCTFIHEMMQGFLFVGVTHEALGVRVEASTTVGTGGVLW